MPEIQRDRVTKVSTSITRERVEFDPPPDGFETLYRHVAFVDATNAATSIRIYTRRGDVYYYYDQVQSPTAGRVYNFSGDFVVTSSEHIGVEVVGAAVGDVLSIYSIGYRYRAGEVVI
jgi:hypothetical protein